ncbi:MAG: hypothetical protein AAFY15_04750 [Cyanobacteria bacterium J06648_11]
MRGIRTWWSIYAPDIRGVLIIIVMVGGLAGVLLDWPFDRWKNVENIGYSYGRILRVVEADPFATQEGITRYWIVEVEFDSGETGMVRIERTPILDSKICVRQFSSDSGERNYEIASLVKCGNSEVSVRRPNKTLQLTLDPVAAAAIASAAPASSAAERGR